MFTAEWAAVHARRQGDEPPGCRLTPMRDTYHERLDAVTDQLVDMTRIVGSMMSRATQALLYSELQTAESVIAADDDVDDANREIEQRATDLIALQQPVATDLRIVVGSLRMSATLERMGDLARHVAKVARLRYPEIAVPEELHEVFREMGSLAERMIEMCGSVIADKDVSLALQIEQLDDRMDDLHRQLFTTLVSPEWKHSVEQSVDITLLSRYYE